MKIVVNGTTYTKIRNLNFSPEVDLTCTSLPVNEFRCDVASTSIIPAGATASLQDDLNQVWAEYRITSSEWIEQGIVRITAEFDLSILDETTMEMVIYGTTSSYGTFVETVIEEILLPLTGTYTIDPEIAQNCPYVKGSAPRQTRRERLLWVLFAVGGYVAFSWGGGLQIKAISGSPVLIPIKKTFWKPTVKYNEVVTKIKVTTHEYEEGDPTDYEDYIVEEEFSDGGHNDEFVASRTPYVHTKKRQTIENEDAPSGSRENIIEIDDITLITEYNKMQVLSRLASRYFKNREVEADVINNREYYPGQRVILYMNPRQAVQGYIKSCSFKFGNQARSKIKIVGVGDVDGDVPMGGKITIRYVYQGTILEEETYWPEDWTIVYTAKYIDKILDAHRIIFRPAQKTYTITVSSADQVIEIQCGIALDLYNGVLHIVSVDKVDSVTENGKVIVRIDEADAPLGPGEDINGNTGETADDSDEPIGPGQNIGGNTGETAEEGDDNPF